MTKDWKLSGLDGGVALAVPSLAAAETSGPSSGSSTRKVHQPLSGALMSTRSTPERDVQCETAESTAP